MSYKCISVRFEDSLCFLKFDRPDAGNTLNEQLVAECGDVLAECEESVSLVVLSGSRDIFCLGADMKALANESNDAVPSEATASALYDLWLKLATGPYVTVSHVQGKVNAGGLGFIGASDVVVAGPSAQFSLSEMLFGLYPACVLPFLIRRLGFQRAHYLTLMTQPIPAQQAREWGLVDAFDAQSDALLHRHLLRLRRLSKPAIRRYKAYCSALVPALGELRSAAIRGNLEVFRDTRNMQAISRYVQQGLFPWERP